MEFWGEPVNAWLSLSSIRFFLAKKVYESVAVSKPYGLRWLGLGVGLDRAVVFLDPAQITHLNPPNTDLESCKWVFNLWESKVFWFQINEIKTPLLDMGEIQI